MNKIGIVGFAFGLATEAEEPNPSNSALADAIDEALWFVEAAGDEAFIVTQWEITKGLDLVSLTVNRSVEQNTDGSYLDSKGVWEVAKADFHAQGITQVIIVAQPFLHLPALKKMVRADGFEVNSNLKIGEIPFYNSPSNTQPWTRTKFALAVYAVKALFGMKRGHDGMQNDT